MKNIDGHDGAQEMLDLALNQKLYTKTYSSYLNPGEKTQKLFLDLNQGFTTGVIYRQEVVTVGLI